ncbi:MAG: cytochrome o ubiquinol oxidase subunit IV [Rhodospirillales bacterium]|nr:cytochrome o ubiquinol oxidase subunit IV [Rhodospirillales bacterium]
MSMHEGIVPEEHEAGTYDIVSAVRNYLIGFVLAAALTVGSFWVASSTGLVYQPGIPMALAAFAIAQMGVHLAFFLHITTGPDNINNVLALAFGVLIVGIVIVGSLWIMYHLNANMGVPGELMDLHMQP